jgi:ubiquinone/menaquinone biosynthesis C-methylase UbiE
MKVSRNFSVHVQYILDQWVPPRIRDSKWFMYLPMRLVLKGSTKDFMTFKESVFTMTPQQFSALYERTGDVQELQGETDLNQACIDQILKAVKNRKVLEVGCGRGYLAKKLAQKNKVTACDIVIPERLKKAKDSVKYLEANIEALPFKDNSFEYVVSTHTLEHVQNLPQAVAELQRVAAKGLVIVVPKQRPYKYTFSLHTQFFPYRWSLENAFGSGKHTTIKDLGDWYYFKDVSKS